MTANRRVLDLPPNRIIGELCLPIIHLYPVKLRILPGLALSEVVFVEMVWIIRR